MTVFFPQGNIRRRGNVAYRDGYVKLPGRQLHYIDYGGMGEIVVALHGYVQNAHAFDGIAPALVPHLHLLALDMRGRGGSDNGTAESYRIHRYLQDLQEFFDALELSRFALIGTSMGGHLALLYATAYPGKVTRLVLNDVVLDPDRTELIRLAGRFGQAPARFVTIQEALAWFLEERGNLDHLDNEERLAWVSHFLVPAETGGYRFNCDPILLDMMRQPRPNLGPKRMARQQLVWEQAKRLKMPVLILRGANSEAVSRENARRMVEWLPAARCVEVPGAGHSPTLYEPAVQSALRDFFGISAP